MYKLNLRKLVSVLIYSALVTCQSSVLAQDSNRCEGLGIEVSLSQSETISGVTIDQVTPECDGDTLGLKLGDTVVSLNGDTPETESFSALLSQMLATNSYSIEIVDVEGNERVISNTDPTKIEAIPLQESSAEPEIVPTEYKTIIPPTTVQNETPIYANVDEVGSDWTKWMKWFVFFLVLSFTLTPLMLLFASKKENVALYLGGSAVLGAANAKGNVIKGAVDGAKFAVMFYFILLFLGPFGALYCIYHPLTTLFSDSDKTYCCAMTWLGSANIAKKSISPDGRWLAEIKETQNAYLGLGDKELAQNYSLSVMDLSNGNYIKWPHTGQKLLGVDSSSEMKAIAVNDGIFIQPVDYLSDVENWYEVEPEHNYTRAINAERVAKIQVSYQLLNADTKYQEVNLQELSSGKIITIQSKMAFNAHFISYDGSVLALVKAQEKDHPSDGLIKQLTRMLSNYLVESWTIEFWDVANGKRIATFSGHGVNQDAWGHESTNHMLGHTNFLESSQDGMLWYMIKSDGFIHVFDMNKHLV